VLHRRQTDLLTEIHIQQSNDQLNAVVARALRKVKQLNESAVDAKVDWRKKERPHGLASGARLLM